MEDPSQIPVTNPEERFKIEENKFYICNCCKEIPNIQMVPKKGTPITVSCKCSLSTNNPNEEERVYTLPLQDFLSEIKIDRENPLCEVKNKHDPKDAQSYCSECQTWYCKECLDEHNESTKDHTLFSINGMAIKSLCEMPKCPGEEKIAMYCKDCRKHLCLLCKKNHEKTHNVVDLRLNFNEDMAETFNQEINKTEDFIRQNWNNYENLIKEMQEEIGNIQNFLNHKKKDDENFICYLRTLYNSYNLTKKINNFVIQSNIKDCDLTQLKLLRELEFYKDFRTQFKILDLFKINQKEKKDDNIPRFKVAVIGDEAVGKSQIINRYCNQNFNKGSTATKECNFSEKELKGLSQGKAVKLEIWDTPGLERLKQERTKYIKQADAIVLVYSVQWESSLKNIKKDLDEIRSSLGGDRKVFCLMGNKSDIKDRKITHDMGKQFAADNKIEIFNETSADKNNGIKETFKACAEKMLESGSKFVSLNTMSDFFMNAEKQIENEGNKTDKGKKGKKKDGGCKNQ